MDVYSQLRKTLQKICQEAAKTSALVPAVVKSVDGETCTVSIGTLELADVRLRAVVNDEESGITVTPSEGSHVMITDLSNGEMRDWAVVMYSQIDQIEINSGQNGGLINISELTDKLNNLVDEVNDLKEKFNSHTHIVNTTGTAAAQSGTAATTTSLAGAATRFNKDDYEDTKITH